jgi:hypothetical protein
MCFHTCAVIHVRSYMCVHTCAFIHVLSYMNAVCISAKDVLEQICISMHEQMCIICIHEQCVYRWAGYLPALCADSSKKIKNACMYMRIYTDTHTHMHRLPLPSQRQHVWKDIYT